MIPHDWGDFVRKFKNREKFLLIGFLVPSPTANFAVLILQNGSNTWSCMKFKTSQSLNIEWRPWKAGNPLTETNLKLRRMIIKMTLNTCNSFLNKKKFFLYPFWSSKLVPYNWIRIKLWNLEEGGTIGVRTTNMSGLFFPRMTSRELLGA